MLSAAVLDGWNYAWIDTCCIDKTSSAELSEAINSMFEWYNESRVCYAYLSDVHYTALEGVGGSKWWTRGWTLQELIAPRNVIFYDAEWREIGTKRSLEVLISSISGISREHLHDYATASVAQKMSWASKRKTTRKEDEAYCLMGIFNLHMPLLYGEGGNAFRRLQLEILANSDDESILAWTTKPKYPSTGKLLAISPAAFYDAGGIVEAEVDKYRPPFSMTNKGLRIEFFLLHRREDGKTLAPLNCVDTRKGGNIIALSLFKMGTRNKDTCDNRYHRGSKLHHISETPRFRGRRTAMFLTNEERTCAYMSLPIAFCIRTDSLLRHGFTAVQEHVYDTCMKIETREISRLLKGEGGLKAVLSSEGAFVCYKFTSEMPGDLTRETRRNKTENADSFALLLGRERMAGSVVFIAEENEPMEADIHKLLETGKWERGLDRISKAMRSGRSVSVALRQRSWRDVIDITIDPQGDLPWPDLGG